MQVSGYPKESTQFWLGFILMVLLTLPLLIILGILARINLKFKKTNPTKVILPDAVVVDPQCTSFFAKQGICNCCEVYSICITSLVLEKNLEKLK